MSCMKKRTIDWYELYKEVGMEFTEQDRDALYQTWMSQNRECELRRWSFQKTRNEPA